MVTGVADDERPFLLATLPPSHGQKRTALGVVVALLVAFAVTVPFTSVQLPRVDAFIPAFATAIVFNDLITAALLFVQFSIVRWWALLVLANGFLYTALIAIPHALSFPGAFAPTGLLGAGLQTTAFHYYIWHAGPTLAVIGYVLLKDTDNRSSMSQTSPVTFIGWSVALTISIVCVLVWLSTAGDRLLPRLFVDGTQANQSRIFLYGGLIASLDFVTLALLWLRRRSMLDLWLMVRRSPSSSGRKLLHINADFLTIRYRRSPIDNTQ
jgi:hypothetical protein